mmetsp:Transcript_11046/g.24111  ORF Transcript_11046/g.24111 Transcript_11046/m.24111 type:complete len:87 (-) Transcript_11046:615-875(-)
MGAAAPLPLLLLALAPTVQNTAEDAALSEAECRSLGFAPSLLCSSCTKLAEFIPAGDSLIQECEHCCTAESAESGAYAKATLDVCK